MSGLVSHKSYGWKLFEGLKTNGALVPGANAQALNPVLQGARAAVMGAVDYIALGAREKGEGIEVIYPASGTVLEARPAMILQSSKNADNAKRFIDYILSQEGQALVADTYLLPARTDIKAKRAGWADIKLLDQQASSEQERLATLQRFKSVMGLK
ncbi:MAG: extracellular solute-binding protein [Beijerinckiaceae bacterium]|nr:extracellular solute-binding protein [Beijerinckiaceae bacterium]